MRRPFRFVPGLAALMLAVALPVAATPGPRVFHADYVASFLGIKVGKSSFTTRFDGRDYQSDAAFSSAGLGALLDDTSGTVAFSGRLGQKGPEPSRYALRYTSGKKAVSTDIVFARGQVREAVNVPAARTSAGDYIPLTPADLAAVADPLTAVMVSAPTADAVCARTLRVFDGETRVDLPLSPAGTAEVQLGGRTVTAVKCKARFQPVAGYRKNREAIDYLRRRGAIEIAFAATGMPDLWAPVAASVGTQVGTVRIRAIRFGD